MPITFSLLVSRVATPQMSMTDRRPISPSRSGKGTESQWHTPPKAGLFFAHLFASFASGSGGDPDADRHPFRPDVILNSVADLPSQI
jgi:hypothetical protein